MTDEEIICTWMEPKPAGRGTNELWWRWGWRRIGASLPRQDPSHEYCWLPRRLTLDALREVQERLTEEQWDAYDLILAGGKGMGLASWKARTHASAEQKIAALARVLRPLVEKAVKL